MLVVVTGLSGAGQSTALNALEDIGFETIDNLPISLIPALLDHKNYDRNTKIALGIDSRTADLFTPKGQGILRDLQQTYNDTEIIFLNCNKEVLLRRFSVTRRRHPLDNDDAKNIQDVITKEATLLEPLQQLASQVLETGSLTPHQLSAIIRHYCLKTSLTPKVLLSSFSYGNGLPPDADMVFDMRFLKNPHYEPDLQNFTGQEKQVAAYIQQDQRFETIADNLESIIKNSLAGFKEVGKSYCHYSFGCTGGRHRSVFMAEYVKTKLEADNSPVLVQHRVIE